MMNPTQNAVDTLLDAIFTAAAAITDIAQRDAAAADEQERDIRWLGAAFESLSFYMMLSIRIAETRDVDKAKALAYAVGDMLLPRITSTFFEKNPADVQEAMIRAFQENYFDAEADYAQCRTVISKTDINDPEALASRLAGRLLPGSDGRNERAARLRQDLRLEIVATVAATMETLELDKLVFRACDALRPAAERPEAPSAERLCPCGSGAPFSACHGDAG